MGEGTQGPANISTIVTLILFVVFIIVCVVCVVPNLYFIEFNTADIEDNTSQLNPKGHISDLLLIADGDIKQLHDDMLILHDLLTTAAGILIDIRSNTDYLDSTKNNRREISDKIEAIVITLPKKEIVAKVLPDAK